MNFKENKKYNFIEKYEIPKQEEQPNESNSLSRDKNVIIICSDIHLGASHSECVLFDNLLNEIFRGYYGKNVKALLIIGDYFDACVQTYRKLVENFMYLQKKLSKIYLDINIPVIFILGNHEIPVTGDLNNTHKFEKRRYNLYKNLYINYRNCVNQQYHYSRFFFSPFFLLDSSCQTLLIRKTKLIGNNKKMYDYKIIRSNSLKGLLSESENKYGNVLNVSSTNNGQFNCFVVHGHQFESKIARNLAGYLFWSRLIKTNNDYVKSFVNFLWNDIIHSRRSVEGLKKKEIKQILDQIKIGKKNKLIKKIVCKIFNYELKRNSKKNNKYFKKIVKFLKSKPNDISHIVFGHTHKMEIIKINNKKENFVIANSGGWQKKFKPTYLEVDLDNSEIIRKYALVSNDLRIVNLIALALDYLFFVIRKQFLKNNIIFQEPFLLFSTSKLLEIAQEKSILPEGDKIFWLMNFLQNYLDELPREPRKIDIKDLIERIKYVKDRISKVNELSEESFKILDLSEYL